MSTKSREVIWGGRIMGADIRAKGAREAAQKAIREADHAEAYAWSIRMEGYGGPAQPAQTIAQCLNGGLAWLEVECNRCKNLERGQSGELQPPYVFPPAAPTLALAISSAVHMLGMACVAIRRVFDWQQPSA